ncbi:MAG: S41 family peptidase [Roseburia sp.]
MINILVLLVVFVGTYCNPYRNSISMYANPDYYCREYGTELTYGEAKADLDQAMQYLKNVHPLFIHGLTADVQELYEQAVAHLQEDESISMNDLSKEIEMIFSSLGDGHTHVGAYYPEYHYLKYIYGHNLANDELVAVNGSSIEEIFEANRNAFSYETEEYGIGYIEVYLQAIEDLDYLGFDIEDGITYTYRDTEGKLFDETYYAEDFLTSEEYWEYNDPKNLRNNKSNDAYEFVKYEIMEPENLAVLTLYSCEYNEEYRECLADMFREVKEKGIANVCVDLRDNGGGNSLVADEFIHYLAVDSYRTWGQDWRLGLFLISSEGSTLSNHQYADLLFDGNVYVLTSTHSFSSAMDFAMLISDNRLGMIVGESSGNKPRSYGDISVFKLKNSGLVMQVSTKKWYRVDETITDELVEPDIECNSEDALQVLVEYLKEQ